LWDSGGWSGFRDVVVPGDRLYVVTELTKVRRGRMIECRFQGLVRQRLVVEGSLKGVPLPVGSLSESGSRDESPPVDVPP
jgi:hypothetical protein